MKDTTDTPLVSVILPTFRRSSSLERAINSLLNQTYSKIEIVIVDDNANEEWNAKVKQIIEKCFKDSAAPVVYIRNYRNRGSAESRNIGILKSSGEYITFLDDDDLYAENKIGFQLVFMMENHLDYSISNLSLYEDDERFIEVRSRDYINSYVKGDLLKYHLMYHMTGTSTLMFVRAYIVRIGMFDTIDIGDEFYLVLRAIQGGGKFGYLNKCYVKAYVHRQDGLSSGPDKIRGEKQLFEYKQKYFSELTHSEKSYIVMRHYMVIAYAYMKSRKRIKAVGYLVLSLLSNPVQCLKLIGNRLLLKRGKMKIAP